jgi:hypothetical protein
MNYEPTKEELEAAQRPAAEVWVLTWSWSNPPAIIVEAPNKPLVKCSISWGERFSVRAFTNRLPSGRAKAWDASTDAGSAWAAGAVAAAVDFSKRYNRHAREHRAQVAGRT